MRGKIVYPYSDELLKCEFSKSHPLIPDRLKLTYMLSEEIGLLDDADVFEPSFATRKDLELFHTPEYIDAVIQCKDSNHFNDGHSPWVQSACLAVSQR